MNLENVIDRSIDLSIAIDRVVIVENVREIEILRVVDFSYRPRQKENLDHIGSNDWGNLRRHLFFFIRAIQIKKVVKSKGKK